jgi:hypothetical protein
MNETIKTTKTVSRLIGKTHLEGKSEGDRLIKYGMALIAFPDPPGFPSDVAGISLVFAGLIKRKMKPTTVTGMLRIFHYEMTKFKDLTCELNEARLIFF